LNEIEQLGMIQKTHSLQTLADSLRTLLIASLNLFIMSHKI